MKTSEYLRPGVKSDTTNVHIDPLILFTCLTAILQCQTDSAENFDYELTPEPASLFKEGIMQKPQKAVLRNLLLHKAEHCHNIITNWCVADGGALLHKVKWPTDSTFGEIVQIYVNYMTIKYGKFENIGVVFDGYTNTLSTKGEEHARRAVVVAANVSTSEIMQVTTEREEFLRNTANKVQFIDFLINAFKREKINVFQSDGDADVMIVTEAIKLAAENAITIFSDDTDVLVLLLYHWSPFIYLLYTLVQKEFLTKRKYKNNEILSVSSLSVSRSVSS